MKIVRTPRPKLRYPKPKIKAGGVFEFKDGFPYAFVSRLNAVGASYRLEYVGRKLKISIITSPSRPWKRIHRVPHNKKHGIEVDIVADIQAKHQNKNPELSAQLNDLVEKFRRKGRKTYLHCPKDPGRACKDVTVCLARCQHKCSELSAANIMPEGDDRIDFFKDLLKIQRLVNVIYGTVRFEDHFKKDDDD
jgi:hypothetical protein